MTIKESMAAANDYVAIFKKADPYCTEVDDCNLLHIFNTIEEMTYEQFNMFTELIELIKQYQYKDGNNT